MNSATCPPGCPARTAAEYALIRSEIPDRVVAPVICEAAINEELLGDAFVDWEQFYSSYPQLDQMSNGCLVGESSISAAEFRRDVRMGHRKTLDVHLVNDGVGVRVMGARSLGPREARVDHQATRNEAGRVQGARLFGVTRRITEHFWAVVDRAANGPGIRISQQLGRVAAHPIYRVVRTGGAKTVGLSRPYARYEAVPHAGVVLLKRQLRLGSRSIEKA